MEKTCLYCGVVFKTSDNRSKYCGLSCAAKGRKRAYSEKKTCILCGKEYNATAPHQKYCTEKCYNKSRRSYDANRYATKKELDCACLYNAEVECFAQTCGSCGWNPEVAKARLDKIMEARHEG